MNWPDTLAEYDFKSTGELGGQHVSFVKRYYDPATDATYTATAQLARGTKHLPPALISFVITVTAVVPARPEAAEQAPEIMRGDLRALIALQAPTAEAPPVQTARCAIHGGETNDYAVVATPSGPSPSAVVCRACLRAGG
jgi:hypothetical protein